MRSFGLVDQKLAEADFFLQRLAEVTYDFFAAECYFSAFAAAARSTTFALQGCLSDLEDFPRWYAEKQKALRSDPLARFFHRVRTESQHLGVAHIRGGSSYQEHDGERRHIFYFQSLFGGQEEDTPSADVVTACREHLTNLVQLVFECYDVFGLDVDPEQYYTVANLKRLGKSIDDLEEELGFPRGWTSTANFDESTRLRLLREHMPPTELDEIFDRYLGKTRQHLLERHGA